MRKPTKDGHVTSLEAYDADGEMIIQFFGKRQEGEGERADWRFLAENLPRIPAVDRGLRSSCMTSFCNWLLARCVRVGARCLSLLAARRLPSPRKAATVFPDASRIVAIGGSITEIVYALGEEERLVARDSTSVYPEAALKLPDVGYMRAAVAGRRAVGQSDRHPRARGQRPARKRSTC